MTDTPAAAIPAGWYDDATTPGQLRWWDGTAWTEHTAVAAASASSPGAGAGAGAGSSTAAGSAQGAIAYTAVPVRPLLPADRPVDSPFIWLIVLLPLVTYGLFFTWQPDFAEMSRSTSSANPTAIYGSILTPGYFLILASSWVIYGLTVFLAFRDRVWLERQGVVRPFHWAWAFLGGLVYVIGRTVIVRRVAAPRGLAPIWGLVGVFVLGIIISIAWTALLAAQMVNEFPVSGG